MALLHSIGLIVTPRLTGVAFLTSPYSRMVQELATVTCIMICSYISWMITSNLAIYYAVLLFHIMT